MCFLMKIICTKYSGGISYDRIIARMIGIARALQLLAQVIVVATTCAAKVIKKKNLHYRLVICLLQVTYHIYHPFIAKRIESTRTSGDS